MIGKAVGIIIALIGFLMLKFFPEMSDYQKDSFSKSGVLIGIILILVGIVLIIVG